MSVLVVFIVVFLVLSGLMAAIDAAILGVTQPEVDELIDKGRPGATSLARVKVELTRAVVVVVVLTNAINVLGPILVSQQAVATYGTRALVAITILLTVGTIVFSEIIPKAIGTRYAPTISRISAPVIRVVQFAMFPLVLVIEWFSKLFTRGQRQIGTEAQIRSLTTIGRRAGYIEHDEGRLVDRAFVMNDRTAEEIMTPLDDVISVSSSMTIGDAIERVKDVNFSRYPLFGANVDDVQGVVMIRDILRAAAAGRVDELVSELAREPFVVAADDQADAMLVRFRRRHVHLAVVQRAGHTIGVVTLEDVLELLVGAIDDEKDVE